MKKVVVFFIVAIVVFGVCSAQRAEAQSANNAQKIIGTWVDQDGKNIGVFNANGTGNLGGEDIKYIVFDTKLAVAVSSQTVIYDILFSSDGKTLILYIMGIPTSGGNGIWLTKK